MDTTRIRATLISIAIVLGLIGYVVYKTVEDKKQDLQLKTQVHREHLQNVYDLTVMEAEKGLNDLALQILTDRNLIRAFETHDRELLYRIALPYLLEAKKEGRADLAGFIQSDGIHFLRLTDPKKYGDNIAHKRPMIAEVLKTGKKMVSLDVTLYNISLVTLVPIIEQGRLLGVLQMSVKIDRIQQGLDRYSGVKSALAFDTKTVEKFFKKESFQTLGRYSLVSSNDPLFQSLPTGYDFSKGVRFSHGNKVYILAVRELKTYSNTSLAQMLCALDITKDEQLYKQEIRKIIVISLVVLLLLSLVLHYGFKALIDRIHSLSNMHAKELEYQLYTDALTDCPNRMALLRDIGSGQFNAMVLLNIDNFKEMNDLYGHEIGDKILIEISHVLGRVAESFSLTLYKMHADEYALVFEDWVSTIQFDAICERILLGLKETYYTIEGVTVFISISMGGDVCDDEGCDLVGRSDMALKMAKGRGISFVRYQEMLHIKENYSNNILWSKQLKEAIDGNHFALFYHGVHDIHTQQPIGYEALIRIVQNNRVIPPVMFLEIAKKSRLYVYITRFVIEEIFRILSSTPYRFSINLSVDDILNPETRELIFSKLRINPVGERLTFEILESEGIENYDEVSNFIRDVKGHGCRIAIDDFGSGYSNFAYLMKLHVDYIKIDGSLIQNLAGDTSVQKIVQTIVEFAHQLELKTVAEFVSNEAIFHECEKLGIDFIQGYYLSEPLAVLE